MGFASYTSSDTPPGTLPVLLRTWFFRQQAMIFVHILAQSTWLFIGQITYLATQLEVLIVVLDITAHHIHVVFVKSTLFPDAHVGAPYLYWFWPFCHKKCWWKVFFLHGFLCQSQWEGCCGWSRCRHLRWQDCCDCRCGDGEGHDPSKVCELLTWHCSGRFATGPAR